MNRLKNYVIFYFDDKSLISLLLFLKFDAGIPLLASRFSLVDSGVHLGLLDSYTER